MKRIQRILLITIPIAIVLTLAEVALQTNPHLAPNTPLTPAYNAPCFTTGTYYWFNLKPNNTCVVKSIYDAFAPFTITSNELGLRDKPLKKEKTPNTKRVLFLGDSFAMGWGVAHEEAYAKQVQQIWNESNPSNPIETINAGLVFSAQGYQYLFLKHTLETIKPDIIVSGFYPFNDIYDVQFSTQWTQIDDHGLPKKIEAKNTYVDRDGNLRLSYNALINTIPFLRNSRLLLLAFHTWTHITEKDDASLPDAYLRICIYKPQCHKLDPGKEMVKKLFFGIRDIAQEKNIPLLVMRKPAEFIIVSGVRMPKYGIPYTLTPEDKKFSHQEFADFFAQARIPYLDLRDTFLAHQEEKLFYDNDDHWNPTGHRIAAQAISEKLKELITP